MRIASLHGLPMPALDRPRSILWLVIGLIVLNLCILGVRLVWKSAAHHLPTLHCSLTTNGECTTTHRFLWELHHTPASNLFSVVEIYSLPDAPAEVPLPLETYSLAFSAQGEAAVERFTPHWGNELPVIDRIGDSPPSAPTRYALLLQHNANNRVAVVTLYPTEQVAHVIFPYEQWERIYSTTLFTAFTEARVLNNPNTTRVTQ